MCLGMANGYRVPEKENVNESTKRVSKRVEKVHEKEKRGLEDYNA